MISPLREKIMKKRLIAFVMAAAMAPAQAITHYTLALTGSGVHFIDWWQCRCERVDTFDWVGKIDVDAPDGDGAFRSLTWNLDSDRIISNGPGGIVELSESGVDAFITVLNGLITSFGDDSGGVYGRAVRYSGMTATIMNGSLGHHGGSIFGHAVLTTVSPIPEPETWVLMLAGLGALSVLRKRRLLGSECYLNPRACGSQTVSAGTNVRTISTPP
jgi:hypothetical protein